MSDQRSADPILCEPINTELLEALREATWRMREALVRTPRDDLTQRELLTDAIKDADAVIAKAEAT